MNMDGMISKTKCFMYLTLKRSIDVILAIILFLPSTLACVAISALLRFEVKGGPLFIQARIGHKGKVFKIYKLKTMSEKKKNEICTPESDDMRLGQLGRIVRKSGLDELPEILNILLGEMSFVGPRPLLTEYKDRYTEAQWRRHSVLPGITGLAQVKGKEELPFTKRFEYDIYYVENLNLILDVWILLLTLRTLATGILSSYKKHVDLPEFK